MTHLDKEISRLRTDLLQMFALVKKQLRKSYTALNAADKELGREVMHNERRVNAEELKIDRDCENLTALFNPVAIDLRFIFAALKINSHLESIGDSAKGISKLVVELDKPYDEQLLNELQFHKMYEIVNSMIEDNMRALQSDDTAQARHVFDKDVIVEEIHRKATTVIAAHISKGGVDVIPMLNLISIVRRMARAASHSSDIAEEIIFYVEATVLKHEKEKNPPTL